MRISTSQTDRPRCAAVTTSGGRCKRLGQRVDLPHGREIVLPVCASHGLVRCDLYGRYVGDPARFGISRDVICTVEKVYDLCYRDPDEEALPEEVDEFVRRSKCRSVKTEPSERLEPEPIAGLSPVEFHRVYRELLTALPSYRREVDDEEIELRAGLYNALERGLSKVVKTSVGEKLMETVKREVRGGRVLEFKGRGRTR